MTTGVEDKEGKQPAGSEAVAGTEGKAKPPRTLRLAELTAAADRARSEGTTPENSGEAPKDTKGAVEGSDIPSGEGKATPNEATPAGEKPAEKPDSAEAKPKPAEPKEGDPETLDPKAGPDNPFWKTQLGRYIREKEAKDAAELADLRATVKLLESKKEAPPKEESGDEDDLERELGLSDDGERATEKKPAKDTAAAAEETQARFVKSYLANNAKDEFKNDPDFAEVQALMFNREDKENTFNKPWTSDPDACYRINFQNAKTAILNNRFESVSRETTPKPGEGNLKGEDPTVPLGVGGDVRGTDGKPKRKAIDLDPHARRYLEHARSKGRDPDKLMNRAFAVDMGADRGARR